MNANVAEQILQAGNKLSTSENDFISELNQALNNFIGWPYKIKTGSVTDLNGKKSNKFGTLIVIDNINTANSNEDEPIEMGIDNLACVIDSYNTINLNDFREAYKKISDLKNIEKTKLPTSGLRNETLGIIFARKSDLSLEALADELLTLNNHTPYSQWPDVVAILSQGTINYATQFPGENRLALFLLPSQNLVTTSAPAFYVLPVISPTGEHTFNKICSIIFGHLITFSQITKLPTLTEALGNTTNISFTLPGYQFNLKGDLLPVPIQFYKNRYIPQPFSVFNDKSHDGTFSLQYMPWQDGGVVLLIGKVPLQGLLIYLGEKIQNRSSTVNRDNLQISCVLPITENDYFQMLQKIQHQTSFKLVKPDKIIKQNYLNEGTNSPFIARFYIGILALRDAAFQNKTGLDNFDALYNTIIQKLLSIRTTSQDIRKLFSEHAEKVASHKIVSVDKSSIRINENINQKLRKEAESFIIDAARLFKHGIQNLTKSFNIHIGFLYQDNPAFHTGIETLRISNPLLANYLLEIRKWSQELTKLRIEIEHNLFLLPDIQYAEKSGSIHIEEPQIFNQPITEIIKFIFDRLTCFTEDIVAYCLQKKIPKGISFSEIPLPQRNPELPIRFKLTVISTYTSIWELRYDERSFDEK